MWQFGGKGGGPITGGSLGTCLVGTGQVVGLGFGGNYRMVAVTVKRGRVGITRCAPARRRGTEPGGSVKTRRIGRRPGKYVGEDGNSEAGSRCRGSQGGGGTERISGVSRPRNQCPKFCCRGGRRMLADVCCQAVVICGSLLGCRRELTREKPTNVDWILVFANGVSVSPTLWEGLRGWRSWRGTTIPWGSCREAIVERE